MLSWAHDLKHDRAVALKVLRPELAAVLGEERFKPEIHIAARLQHPNILPLYDSGSAAGHLFYVMPFVEGESLRRRLDREKQLPVDDTVRIVGEVADALAYAHDHGVVHRDIQPENVMLVQRGDDPDFVKVLDFGVAKVVGEPALPEGNVSAPRPGHTAQGVLVGTPEYMSPEPSPGTPSRSCSAR